MSFLVSAISNAIGGLLGGSSSNSSVPFMTTSTSAAAPYASLLPQAQADNYLSTASVGALQSMAQGSSASSAMSSSSTDDDAASSLISQSSNGSSGTSSLFGAQSNVFAPSQIDSGEGGGDDD